MGNSRKTEAHGKGRKFIDFYSLDGRKDILHNISSENPNNFQEVPQFLLPRGPDTIRLASPAIGLSRSLKNELLLNGVSEDEDLIFADDFKFATGNAHDCTEILYVPSAAWACSWMFVYNQSAQQRQLICFQADLSAHRIVSDTANVCEHNANSALYRVLAAAPPVQRSPKTKNMLCWIAFCSGVFTADLKGWQFSVP